MRVKASLIRSHRLYWIKHIVCSFLWSRRPFHTRQLANTTSGRLTFQLALSYDALQLLGRANGGQPTLRRPAPVTIVSATRRKALFPMEASTRHQRLPPLSTIAYAEDTTCKVEKLRECHIIPCHHSHHHAMTPLTTPQHDTTATPPGHSWHTGEEALRGQCARAPLISFPLNLYSSQLMIFFHLRYFCSWDFFYFIHKLPLQL